MESGTDHANDSDVPITVSVALLTRNGMPGVAALLAALRAQQGCGPTEIVAVDSGSTDGTLDELARAGTVVHRIDPSEFKFGPTRQKAFGLTRGRVIVTLSQDAIPVGTDWLAKITGPILDGSTDIVQATEAIPPDLQPKFNLHSLGLTYQNWTGQWGLLGCWGMAISRAAWEKTGFGDVPMSEDKYLAAAAMKSGLRFEPSVGAVVDHGHAYTPLSLAKRSFNEGMGARYTQGRYTAGQMARDLLQPGVYRYALSSLIKHRTVSLVDVLMIPIRPVFLWLGFRFGKGYWK